MPEEGLSILWGLGLPGLVIFALAVTCYRLFNLYTDSQEKRITEARISESALKDNSQALVTLTRLIEKGQP